MPDLHLNILQQWWSWKKMANELAVLGGYFFDWQNEFPVLLDRIRSCSWIRQQAIQSKWRSSWLNTESYSLHRFCFISPSLASLCSQFLKNSGIIDKSAKLKQLVGSIEKRISVNISKVINMVNDLSVNFASQDKFVKFLKF